MKTIQFYAKRKIFFSISIIIIIIGIAMAFIQGGVEFDIDFTGGSVLTYSYTGDIDTNTVDNTIEAILDGRTVKAQTKEDAISKEQKLVLTLGGNEGMTTDTQHSIIEELNDKFSANNISLLDASVVEPFIGRRFLLNSMWALILAFILVVIYVWYSFRKIGGLSAGVMAVIALVHDVIILFIAYIVFGIAIDENFIAAALTIIGFSVNDTIVIYDRIRENTLLYGRKMEIDELVDKSITQSLTRSINTNLAVFVSIAIVFVFTEIYGITSMRSFALPMMFGVISGCYSTICLAGPLWVMWKKHKQKDMAR